MHPIAKCCGYYCSCILVLSLAFFGILIVLIESHNPWLTKEFRHDIDTRTSALIIAIIVNGICSVLCIGCVVVGNIQEKKALASKKDDDDFGFDLKNH